MENQHRHIKGYRELNEAEIALINELKAKAEEVGALMAQLNAMPKVDQRAAAIARTELQTGFMWAIRAVAQPTTF